MYEQEGQYMAQADRMFHGDILGSLPAMLLSYGALQVTQTGTGANMAVDIQPGRAAFQGNYTTSEGAYYLWADAVENVVITAAPPAGQERYDLVVAQVRNDYLDSGGNNDWLYQVIRGTPATTGSATVPVAGTNQFALASVHIASQVTSIVTSAITDLRPALWAHVQPAPLASGAAFQSYTDSQGDVWVAKGGVSGGNWKRASNALYARWQRNAALTSSATAAYITFDAVQFDPYSLWQSSLPGFAVPIPGLYRLGLSMTLTTTAAAQTLTASVFQSGLRKMQYTITSQAAGTMTCTTTGIVKCVANDSLEPNSLTTPGSLSYVVNNAYSTWYEINYLGTG
jgi:hypothetical protein